MSIAKNRLGSKDGFRLKFDPERASFWEVSTDDPIDAAMADVEHAKRVDATKRRVLDAIRSTPGLKSKSAVAMATKGRKTDLLGALDLLIAEGCVVKTDAGFRVIEGKDTP